MTTNASRKEINKKNRTDTVVFSGTKEPAFKGQPVKNLLDEEPSKRTLADYVVRPKHVRFETQDSGEKIILLLRRHMTTNLGWLLFTLILFLLPFFLLILVRPGELMPLKYQVLSFILWYLLAFTFGFERFLSWYYNLYIVTDERVVDIDFYSLLYKEVSQAKIDNIQDVTFVTGGLIRTVFNYGTVFIQTAGEKREFDFEDVPHPDKVAKVINELILEEEQEKLEGRVN